MSLDSSLYKSFLSFNKDNVQEAHVDEIIVFKLLISFPTGGCR